MVVFIELCCICIEMIITKDLLTLTYSAVAWFLYRGDYYKVLSEQMFFK
jgi:hypothetical protein